MKQSLSCVIATCSIVWSLSALVWAQDGDGAAAAKLTVDPTELELEVGATAQLTATVTDIDGNPLDVPVLFFSMAWQKVAVTPTGTVEAHRPGNFVLLARVPKNPKDDSRRAEALLEVRIAVRIPAPPVAEVRFVDVPSRFYNGTRVRFETRITDRTGARRQDIPVQFDNSDPTIGEIDKLGYLSLRAPGSTTITARAEGAKTTLSLRVQENPTASLSLTASATVARTGDIIRFVAAPLDAAGNPVAEMPVTYAFRARTTEHARGAPPSGLIAQDGRFVADLPGEYTIVAVSGVHSASKVVAIAQREVKQRIELLGHGRVKDRRTSDLWVWEGTDGRDYALTGTHGAEGHAYLWDVTDPGNMVITDTVRVDARTVNDVKVSEDGRIAVISREGASDRRNGLVLLDVSEPQTGIRILSRYDDQLSGGVHNLFIYQNHVYALSAGRRYDIINIEDPSNPHRVGRFELDTPGHAIHDVWVEDGIAWSSNWQDGVVAVDVGGGGKGGSPRNPVLLGSYAYPSGWNHAAFPYRSKSTGKLYAFAGDESGRRGGTPGYKGEAGRMNGWIHIIEWDDWGNPREVARYAVPEAGSHNLWVEDDVLYIAYYQGGLRVVDISGELMGDLYRQGREIAYFLAYDPDGFVPNAPMAWGPQPFKGKIFFSDWNSGLWAVQLHPRDDARETARER